MSILPGSGTQFPGSPPSGALAGLRVLDLSRVLAGPLCTQMLADQGADVIKVEPPSGDETRTLGPPFNDDGDAAYYTAVNRGKRAIGIDLSRPAGQALLLKLLETADVLVENFVPGTMTRWGLDYESVIAVRYPKLIYCTITGFGDDGPLGGMPGYDAVLQAMCGLMSVNGDAASGPTRMGVPVVDHLTAHTAYSGILLALFHRAQSGRGQRVEATLFDTALSLLVPHAANWMHSGRAPELLGSAHPNIAPYDKFACRDGMIFLGILNERQFGRFCMHVGLDSLCADSRFVSNAQRLSHRDALRTEIERVLGDRTRDKLCNELMQLGVPAGPVNTVPEAFAHPHARHRQMWVERPGYQGIGLPTQLSLTPGSPGASPPRYGQHTEEILREIDMDESQIDALRGDGIVPTIRPAP